MRLALFVLSAVIASVYAGNCGDGILEVDEQCECQGTGSTSCTGCVSCVLSNQAQECSTSVFYMHDDKSAPVHTTDPEFGHTTCCSNGVTEPVSTECIVGPDTFVCHKGGKCKDPCRPLFGYCGQCGSTIGSACRPRCYHFGQRLCKHDWKNGFGYVYGDLPEGSKCVFNGISGECDGYGLCLNSADQQIGDRHCVPEGSATLSPATSRSPTWDPTPGPVTPTAEPTNGANPTPQPTNPTPQPTTGTNPTPQPTTGTNPTPQPTTGTNPTPQPTTGTNPTPQPTTGTNPTLSPTEEGATDQTTLYIGAGAGGGVALIAFAYYQFGSSVATAARVGYV